MLTREKFDQEVVVKWFRAKYPHSLIFAIPNGGRRALREAVHLKSQGVLAGVPDLMIAEIRGGFGGLFVEMKRTPSDCGKIKGVISQEQKRVIAHLSKSGYKAIVANGWLKAQEIIDEYMDSEPGL